ncbi:hypothetical protein CHARACLAT_018674 [Characodon lateralis]|uniref:Uncharacterized protein n=1 Tax=Characodon lateralis TaxID=208331 RepID=A0ABU7ELM0_9TELE|nr:hypothetical protein [Characodon lateralis]
MGERHGTPWTGRQSIAGQHRDIQDKQPCTHSFTPKGNLERPINLKVMFLDCVRKPEYPVKTHEGTGRTFKLHAGRPPARSETQELLAARQQCYQLCHRGAAVQITKCLQTVTHFPTVQLKYIQQETDLPEAKEDI